MAISFPNSPKALRIEKQPHDDRLYTFECGADDLKVGVVTLASGSLGSQAKAGNVPAGADLTVGGVTVSGTRFQVKIGGGTDGEDYKLQFRFLDSLGGAIEYDIVFLVRD